MDIPIKITPAPNPTCCRPDKEGKSRKSYRTPNNNAKPNVVTADPKINLLINDLSLGVKVLSLIASIGLTWEAFLAGSREDRIVTVIPTIAPVIAASVVKTSGPSGKPNSKYFNPSLTTTARPIPRPIPMPEPINDINIDSDKTSL